MPNLVTKGGKAGYWWIINVAPNSTKPLFWTGHILTELNPIYDFNSQRAAQFESKESAEFQAKLLIRDNKPWQAERHLWK